MTIYEAVGVDPPKVGICGEGTQFLDGTCVPDKQQQGGGCLIATATYGSEFAPEVQKLRELRDSQLLSTHSGTSFMTGFNQLYYSFSPTIADWERENPSFKEFVKYSITPLLTTLSILNYVDIDSEEKALLYGLSIIMLNIGMYFAAPAFFAMSILKRRKKSKII